MKYGEHDKVPEESEADNNRKKFRSFTKYINNNYGRNSMQDLFNSDMSDGQKMQQIDVWWNEWKTYEKQE
jgi:hypothetical protein